MSGKQVGRTGVFSKAAIRNRFLKALRSGSTIKMACAAAGISEGPYYNFMNRETPPNGMSEAVFVQFKEDITLASDRGASELLTAIANDSDWRAKAWVLERRRPGDFGKIERHEVTGQGGGPVGMVNVGDLPDEVVRLLAEAAEKIGGGDGPVEE